MWKTILRQNEASIKQKTKLSSESVKLVLHILSIKLEKIKLLNKSIYKICLIKSKSTEKKPMGGPLTLVFIPSFCAIVSVCIRCCHVVGGRQWEWASNLKMPSVSSSIPPSFLSNTRVCKTIKKNTKLNISDFCVGGNKYMEKLQSVPQGMFCHPWRSM